MAIINFYEKYGISQTDELEKIQWVINQKITDEENDSFDEGHSERMFFLESAKEAFATAKSKVKYDQDLADSMKKRDPDGERKAAFEKWYGDAKSYSDSEQYDLAKTAIDRAFQYATPETADYSFYGYAADIYSLTANFSQAVEYANQAIVVAPDNYYGYFIKMVALDRYMFGKNLSNDIMQDIWKQLSTTIKLMVDKAIATGHSYDAAQGYGLLAKMYYKYVNGAQYPITGNNNALAEEYAVRAFSLLESGQSIAIAKAVIDDIAARRAEIAKLEKANAELERQNSNLQSTVSSQKSSINNATTFGSTSFGGELWFGIIAGVVGFIALAAGGGGFGALCLIVAIATFAIKGGIIAKNKNIRDTLASIRENESKINNNTYQINNNRNIISQQSAGLAPHPIKL